MSCHIMSCHIMVYSEFPAKSESISTSDDVRAQLHNQHNHAPSTPPPDPPHPYPTPPPPPHPTQLSDHQ